MNICPALAIRKKLIIKKLVTINAIVTKFKLILYVVISLIHPIILQKRGPKVENYKI